MEQYTVVFENMNILFFKIAVQIWLQIHIA